MNSDGATLLSCRRGSYSAEMTFTGDIERIQVIDSHTGGESTRVIVDGGPDPGTGSMARRRDVLRERFDAIRSAVVNEPRGSDAMVGALLCEPVDDTCAVGVIFFNNVGYLNMCGHGTIGVIATLAHMKRIQPGEHRIETPVGVVSTILHDDARVTVRNVPSWRRAAGVTVNVEQLGIVSGDVAWGGNWFFLTGDHGESLEPENVDRLVDVAWRIRRGLEQAGVTGDDGDEIDHIELFARSPSSNVDSRSFVLCPGGAWDRSPCGTGTSAKLACLAADGSLKPGEPWRQESIIGSVFEGTYESGGDRIIPSVTGTAWVNSEATLILQKNDPFRLGIGQ